MFLPRRLVLVLPLVLLSACGVLSLATDPEHKKIVGALTAFLDTVEKSDYAAASALMCPDEPQSEADLRTEFEPHPRPWKQKVTATSRDDTSGHANLDLTPADKPVVRYTFDVVKIAGGSWQVCDVSRGSYAVDVD